jgi:hypothetical protein
MEGSEEWWRSKKEKAVKDEEEEEEEEATGRRLSDISPAEGRNVTAHVGQVTLLTPCLRCGSDSSLSP